MITRGFWSGRLTQLVSIRGFLFPLSVASRTLFQALVVVAVLGTPAPARADAQLWVLASMTKSLSDDWRINVDVAPRWERDASDYSRTVWRTQLARLVRRNVAVAAGYEFQNPASFYVRQEHRIWQQVQVQHLAAGWTLSHRARVEERWLRNIDPLVVRARYALRAGRPFGGRGRWQWFALDEAMYTLRGDDVFYPQGFDRNRLGAGIGRALSPNLTVEAGVTWQAINRSGRIPTQHDGLIALNVLARY
jgi:hypothetical protein